MLLFIDGEIVITSVEQNIDLYYQAYIAEFSAISRTKWEGSKEYEIAYANSQRDFANDTVFNSTLEKVLNSLLVTNQSIKRPAVLHSRVAERFAEEGYIATIRVADDTTKGIVAICVDMESNQTIRAVTIGAIEVGEVYGYNSGAAPPSAIDNDLWFDGINVINFLQGRVTTGVFNLGSVVGGKWNDKDSVYILIAGYGSVKLDWNGLEYEVIDAPLVAFLQAADATVVDFTITDVEASDSTAISELIVFEMLPAGQHMIGNVSAPVVISNGQSVLAQWATPIQHDLVFKMSLTIDQNSPYPVDDVDTIVERFLENFAAMNALGRNITPEVYYQIVRDAPWASQIVITYSLDGAPDTGAIYVANYDDKFNATLAPADVTIIG